MEYIYFLYILFENKSVLNEFFALCHVIPDISLISSSAHAYAVFTHIVNAMGHVCVLVFVRSCGFVPQMAGKYKSLFFSVYTEYFMKIFFLF